MKDGQQLHHLKFHQKTGYIDEKSKNRLKNSSNGCFFKNQFFALN
jgi:hypothetical protein